MTIEEAIKVLEKQFDKSCGNYRYQNAEKLDFEDALWMAISALLAQQKKNICGCTNLECSLCTPGPCEHRKQPNAPLTLDELRSAYKFGCPVWLVGMEDGDGWVFIHHVDSCSVRYARIGTSEEWCFRTKSYGVRVWAYRQKPEEGTV